MTLFRRARQNARAAQRLLRIGSLIACAASASPYAQAQTTLADQPLFSNSTVPGNLAFVLSVEYPTAVDVAYSNRTYSSANTYLGYFDPNKCYSYYYTDGTGANNYFIPAAAATSHTCSSKWSGNFLNWATMQTIDPFRWVLTGGYRVIDTATTTVLEKAWASGQGGTGDFPDSSVNVGADIAGATPFPSSTSSLSMSIQSWGNKMVFAVPNSSGVTPSLYGTATAYNGTTLTNGVLYTAFIRAKVCDPSLGAALLESNCTAYGSNYKPEGLIQKYSNQVRFSAFGYLNDADPLRDGGVLRAQQKFVGPTQPVPGSAAVTNAPGATTGQTTGAEWSAADGTFTFNPDAADATNTAGVMGLPSGSITNSGVINYLNKFGETARTFKTYDNVSELYYAAIRYFKNLPSVPEWTAVKSGTTQATIASWTDGFPVITSPPDPILYSCQRNFILGIGDVNTWNDKDVPGNTNSSSEPTMPALVAADTSVNAVTRTNQVGVMEGLGGSLGTATNYNGCCGSNSTLIAGLAYDAHVNDIRGRALSASMPKPQTVDTYWVDVQEYQTYKPNNQFYLATKYGGFTVPTGYLISNTAALPLASWHTNPYSDPTSGQLYPDHYYSGGQPAAMQAGLTSAFSSIAAAIAAYTTSFSTSLPQLAQTSNASFSAQYNSSSWTGEVTASVLSFDATTGAPTVQMPPMWTLSTSLATQFAGTGWSSNRRVVSWNGSAGVAFRSSGTSQVASADLAALDTSYVTGNDSVNYLNYLRGDQSNEVGATSGTQAYRARTRLLGDIVGSQAAPIGPPSFPFSDATNPGYTAFKSTWAARRTMVYVGANDGMMHAINGALLTTAPTTPATPPLEVDANAGTEMFAYVPRSLFQGPNSTPNTSGLASLGNPAFTHHYMVNATPAVNDVDFGRTPNSSGVAQTGTPNWHSVLIGGLGKGGRSYYAIDVTDPVGMSASETTAASKVLWEFSDAALGYTYGVPLVMKTAKYGWVAVFTSGYNNADGKGYFIFVNPKTGALLEKVSTGVGSTSNDAGLAHANGFVVDATNGTVDAIYAGDILGNLWRLDVTAASGAYAAPTKIAVLTDASGNAQPVTSDPSIEIDPVTKKRMVMVGTGRLLSASDIPSTRPQSFYSIADGTNAAFTVTPVSPLSFPYPRTALYNDSNSLRTDGTTFLPSTQAGWYEDLGVDSASGYGWRVIADSTTFSGSVAFAAILPSGNPCSPSQSRVYGLQYGSGVSTVLDSATLSQTPYVYFGGTVTNLRYLSVKGKASLVSGTDTGTVGQINILPPTSFQLHRLNWRELQSVD